MSKNSSHLHKKNCYIINEYVLRAYKKWKTIHISTHTIRITWSHGAKSQGMRCLLCLLAFVANFNFQGDQVYIFLFFIFYFKISFIYIYIYIILKKIPKSKNSSSMIASQWSHSLKQLSQPHCPTRIWLHLSIN